METKSPIIDIRSHVYLINHNFQDDVSKTLSWDIIVDECDIIMTDDSKKTSPGNEAAETEKTITTIYFGGFQLILLFVRI